MASAYSLLHLSDIINLAIALVDKVRIKIFNFRMGGEHCDKGIAAGGYHGGDLERGRGTRTSSTKSCYIVTW